MDPRVVELTRLAAIVDRLRDGCPWDREQTLATMAPCAQEEAAEVADAVANGGADAICEELGDLLMNVFLMARIAEQAERFGLADVARRIAEKLVHRHPHVFGDATARTADQALSQWDQIKEAERAAVAGAAHPRSRLDEVPLRLSPLARAQKLGRKAAKAGFDWPEAAGALDKVREELAELEAERTGGGPRERLEAELGDLLFAVVNVARKLDLDADQALRGANGRFERRYREVERRLGDRLPGATLAEMERAWQAAKAAGM
ncbi:MAG: nucleoside triphosphate pyrophosphohydrolase [Planctomycetes bacterium]|nr:nucleoside triphosphate pyrophosphohydrolase [Planctomycetota bacterium]